MKNKMAPNLVGFRVYILKQSDSEVFAKIVPVNVQLMSTPLSTLCLLSRPFTVVFLLPTASSNAPLVS